MLLALMGEFLDNYLTTCHECNTERVKILFENIREDVKKTYNRKEVAGLEEYFVLQLCGTYSSILYGSSSFEEDPVNRSSNIYKNVSLKASRPCGRQKQYKRCCGKS